ncbi:STAS domain-containing protein [Actinospongicola halichondriae]|uniref:STAS domain-containing protein n=1 Tax=Actinospongicola halichondriae TaxID=3236844 RepID=UPI003D592CC5
MELEISDSDASVDTHGWTVLTATGEIDVAAAPGLREQLVALIENGTTELVVDLEGVDFIDSTGLGVLVGAVRRARSAEGDVRLVCTNSRLLKVFDVTGLDEVFTIVESVDDAITVAADRG